MPGVTPFQTVGPFFEVLLRTRVRSTAPSDAGPGSRAIVCGVLYDGAGQPIPDGLLETWQADAQGRYAPPDEAANARAASGAGGGYGWSATDDSGRFQFETIKPGPVDGPEGRRQAPHLLLSVMARGIQTRYVTRVYFGDEPANESDPILAMVPAERRHTLIAERDDADVYRIDIRVQGENETVFFDV